MIPMIPLLVVAGGPPLAIEIMVRFLSSVQKWVYQTWLLFIGGAKTGAYSASANAAIICQPQTDRLFRSRLS